MPLQTADYRTLGEHLIILGFGTGYANVLKNLTDAAVAGIHVPFDCNLVWASYWLKHWDSDTQCQNLTLANDGANITSAAETTLFENTTKDGTFTITDTTATIEAGTLIELELDTENVGTDAPISCGVVLALRPLQPSLG